MSIDNEDHLNKEIIQWACESLTSLGYVLKTNSPEKVQHTPWSHVVRFETTAGYIYLKHTPEKLALEATIIKTLHEQFHASVHRLILACGKEKIMSSQRGLCSGSFRI